MKTALCLLALVAALPAFAADQAVGSLINARAAVSLEALNAVFDGSRAGATAVPVPAVPSARRPILVSAPVAPADPVTAAPVAPEAPRQVVAPTSARGITAGHLGLESEDAYELGTGRCEACRGPMEGKWYFLDDVIATPKAGPPAIVWIGSHEMLEGVRLSADGTQATLRDGTVVAFAQTPKIDTNRSFYDASSLAYLRGRSLRVRGEFAEIGGVRTLVARTVWPEDFRIDASHLDSADAANAQGVDALVAADKGGAKGAFQAKLLWERPGAARDWEGKPVMGFMLNGAQGDDDEALAGHSSLFTGVYGPDGSMADWVFDNFYDMNTNNEKGIVASMVPLDKYMSDLNSGQSWYRPSYMLVMVMKDARVPAEFQDLFKAQYAKYYSQEIKYDHSHLNCTALIADPVRAEGWKIPETGKTPDLIARGIAKIVTAVSKDPKAGEEIYQSLREEPTRSFPRASFVAAGGDVLSLAGAFGAEPLGRELTPLEKRIQEDLQAVLFVRIPQLPSSRKFGRDPAAGVTDYFMRVPTDRSKWQIVPTTPRPFPPPH